MPTPTWLALFTTTGLAMWSAPLLGSALLGLYRPALLGGAGWIVTVAASLWLLRWHRTQRPQLEMSAWEIVLLGGLTLAAVLYLGFPTESILGGQDESVYANHAISIAREGTLRVPYAWDAEAAQLLAPAIQAFPGFALVPGAFEVWFGHLYPTWLAQAYASFGPGGLYRLTGVFSVLAAATFYGFCRIALPRSISVVATLLLALNVGQLYLSRITLSEILAQLLIWSGLLLVVHALRRADTATARWAGVFLGLSALVRVDSLFLVPLLFLAHLAYRLLEAAKKDTPSSPVSGQSGLTSSAVQIEGKSTSLASAPHHLNQLGTASVQLSRSVPLGGVEAELEGDARRYEPPSVWAALYSTGAPVFAAAAGYYLIVTHVYAQVHASQLRSIGAAALAALLLLLVFGHPRAIRWLGPKLVSTPMLLATALLVVGFAVYAYFIRPILPPFDTYPASARLSLRGQRTYYEDSVVNLAAYLSLPVVWFGVLGVLYFAYRLARGRTNAALLPVLVVIGGYSALYLWEPSIRPWHYWAIRRFVPVIIPGTIFLGAVAASWLGSRLSPNQRRWIGALAVGFLVAHIARTDRLILTFSEYEGMHGAIERLASAVPADRLVLAAGAQDWTTPLYVAHGRRIVRVNLSRGASRDAVAAWITSRLDRGESVYLMTDSRPSLAGLRHRVRHETRLSWRRTETPPQPLPDELVDTSKTVRLYELYGADPTPDYQGVNLVTDLAWGVEHSGLGPGARVEGRFGRWTNGVGLWRVPGGSDATRALRVTLAQTAPKGTRLEVLVNGRTLYSGRAGPGRWTKEFSLKAGSSTKGTVIELRSGTFAPAGNAKTSPARRGVLLTELTLLGPSKAASRTGSVSRSTP